MKKYVKPQLKALGLLRKVTKLTADVSCPSGDSCIIAVGSGGGNATIK
jgi:hypothetical protein